MAEIEEESVVDAPDLTPLIVTLLLVSYILWPLWLIFRTVLPSVISKALVLRFLLGRVLFCKVTKPAALVSNLARLSENFKSWVGEATHVLLFELLKIRPTWGWSVISLPAVSCVPRSAIQTL